MVTDGHLVNVVTCSAEACRAQAEQLARHEVERRGGVVRLVDVTTQGAALPVERQMLQHGYAVTERLVDPKGEA